MSSYYTAAPGEPLWSDRDRLVVGVHLSQAPSVLSSKAAARYAVMSALAEGKEAHRPARPLWSRLAWRRTRPAVAKTV